MNRTADSIRWPDEFSPPRAPIHVRNELAISAPAPIVWAWLIRARDWPSWYANAQDVVIENEASDLTPGATFRWETFGVKLVSHVEEFVPAERLAWNARGLGVWAYHAWLIRPAAAGCTVSTEQTQYGFLARLGALFMPSRMHRFHQLWLEGLGEKAQNGRPKV
jgi:Polyketide cyclase / dehydrase and lipid transport